MTNRKSFSGPRAAVRLSEQYGPKMGNRAEFRPTRETVMERKLLVIGFVAGLVTFAEAGVQIEKSQRFGLHNLRHSLSNWLVNKAKIAPKDRAGPLAAFENSDDARSLHAKRRQ
jgi:hypothetical protein